MKTADLSDKYPRAQICQPLFSSFGQHRQFHGQIQAIKCFEDNSFVREILSRKVNGDILVVDAGGSKRCAMLGDLLAQRGVDNGWSGVIINGLIRDSAEINAMPIGVKALGTIPIRSIKKGQGEPDVAVNFAGVLFTPGNYLYADEDGIIVSNQKLTLN